MKRSTSLLTFLGAIAGLVLTLWLGAEKPSPLFKSEADREQALERLRQMRDGARE